ncbi:MAG: hypothetical protein LBP59_09750 [Planctomycetaceae bacterium]|nr:hypothetical protein [Planctomycetaceae bacterium]
MNFKYDTYYYHVFQISVRDRLFTIRKDRLDAFESPNRKDDQSYKTLLKPDDQNYKKRTPIK